MSKASLLRVVTNRLNSTPVEELPHIAYFLASSIQDCADTLKSASEQPAGRNDDVAIQIHKLKARLASLLQDKSAEGRFTAIVLVKATVEAGGRAVLESCEPWVRGLLAILGRPDPVSSKRLCLLTITRIFCLTQQHPTIIREITTPLLPAFMTACIKLGAFQQPGDDGDRPRRPSPYVETVLQCMIQLIPHHPSTFRPFASKLHTTLMKFIGFQDTTEQISHLAQSVLVALHICAPKDTASDGWLRTCQAAISSIHAIADQILRAVIEDWEPSDSGRRQTSPRKAFDAEPHSADGGPLDLPPWQGLHQGSKMLLTLLHFLGSFLREGTSRSVKVPIGSILDVTSRLLYLRLPTHSKDAQTGIRFNAEVGRDEREELLAILPQIHQSALNLLSCLVEALGLSILPTGHSILDQCIWVFDTEAETPGVRLASYELLDNLLRFLGPSLSRGTVDPLTGIIDYCCRDVASRSMGSDEIARGKDGASAQSTANGHADSFLQSTSKKTVEPWQPESVTQIAASRLLCRIIECVPAQSILHSTRAQIDRTAILTDQKRAMLASVLNPSLVTTGKTAAPSVMPFLARTSQDELEVEGLLRPRMPVIQENRHAAYGLGDQSEEAEEEHIQIPTPINGIDTESLAQPAPDLSTAQNDLLDRLEDSIEDGTVSAPNNQILQTTSAGQLISELSSEQNDSSPHGNPISQGVKRNLETPELHEEEQVSKRLRNDELDLEREIFPAAWTEERPPDAPVAPSAVADPDSAVRVEAEGGTTAADKGKRRAATVSPRVEGLGGFGKEKVDTDGDDESDFEMPPLYLKTSSEEEDEDDDDDEKEIV